MIRSSFLVLILGLVVPSVSAQAGWTHETLDHGVRLSVLHVPEAPREGIFVLLPLGLLDDDAGCEQWSHLLEHMLIRTTESELHDGEMNWNGETSGHDLRLEAITTRERWKDGVAHVLEWLRSTKFDAKVLEVEKGRIAGEVRNTSARPATHKWALVAWNQVVRHGRKSVRVQEAVDAAELDAVERYAKAKVRLGSSLHFVFSGPATPGEIKKALVLEGLGARKGDATTTSAAASRPATAPKDVAWDLSSHHTVSWAPLGTDSPKLRILASLIAQMQQAQIGRQTTGRTLVHGELTHGGRRLLALSHAHGKGEKPKAVEAALLALRQKPLHPLMVRRALAMRAAELRRPVDFTGLRKRVPARARDFLEAQVALSQMNFARQLGVPLPQAADALDAIDPDELIALHEAWRKSAEWRTLRLAPTR